MAFKWNSFLSTIENNGNWVFGKKSLSKLEWTDYTNQQIPQWTTSRFSSKVTNRVGIEPTTSRFPVITIINIPIPIFAGICEDKTPDFCKKKVKPGQGRKECRQKDTKEQMSRDCKKTCRFCERKSVCLSVCLSVCFRIFIFKTCFLIIFAQ